MPIDLDHFRELLLEKRQELIDQDAMAAADRAPVVLEQDSVGRLSRIDAMQQQAMAQAQARRRHQQRAAIDAAMDRIAEAEFGWCHTCGAEIALARLEHNPAVTTCITCAREG